MMPYERFDAWHACYGLTLLTYRITAQFPSHERYGLVSQMRRAAFSTAANIAEGAAKRGRAEFRRFLDMSLGSLSELSVAIRLAKDLSYIDTKQGEEISEACSRAGKVTMGLYKAVQTTMRRSADPPIRPSAHPPLGCLMSNHDALQAFRCISPRITVGRRMSFLLHHDTGTDQGILAGANPIGGPLRGNGRRDHHLARA
jgi:four helix bundle protein